MPTFKPQYKDKNGIIQDLNIDYNSLANKPTTKNEIESIKSDIDKLNSTIVNGVIDGSPKGVYDNLSALQTALSEGASGVYLTRDNGHWCFWNGTEWVDGGLYRTDPDYDALKSNVDKINNIKNLFVKAGGSIEDWSTYEFIPENEKIYNVTIFKFTKRAWLTNGYILIDVYVYYNDGTNKRVLFSTAGAYENKDYSVKIDNSSSNIEKIVVRTRPETNTLCYVLFDDCTIDIKCEKSYEYVNETSEYLTFQSGLADYSNDTVGTTYVGKDMDLYIKKNEQFKLEIISPLDNDGNQIYFNVYNGTTRLNTRALFVGYGSRTIKSINNFTDDITMIQMVVVALNTTALYNVKLYKEKYIIDKINELWANNNEIIPSYFNSTIQNAITKSKEYMSLVGRNGDTFIFISDIHWCDNSKYSPKLIKKITDNLPIENVICGGDLINGGTTEEAISDINEFISQMKKSAKNIYTILGNHDLNTLDGGTKFINNEFYTFAQKISENKFVYGDDNYFYFDNSMTKTRYICLDSYLGNGRNSEVQINWLNDVLASTNSDWHIIIFVHAIYISSSDYTNKIISSFMTSVIAILDEYNSVSENAKIEAIFAGHSHEDYNTSTSAGIPIILIDCDTLQGKPLSYKDTYQEQVFDIVTLNYIEKKIYCVRVGRGNNRIISY